MASPIPQSTAYIVNIPLYFDGKVEHLQKSVAKLLANPLFHTQRTIKVLIGLNQNQVLHPKQIEKGIAFVKQLVKEQNLSDNLEIDVINYRWEKIPKYPRGINYSDIRNKIFQAEQNQVFFRSLQKQFQNIFYLTVDPDSKVEEEIFAQVEKQITPKGSPLVLVGHYKFALTDSQLVQSDQKLNWINFLTSEDNHFDRILREEIAKSEFSFVKYPYQSIEHLSSFPQDAANNLLALENILKRSTSGKLTYSEEVISFVKKLVALYQQMIQEEVLTEENFETILKIEEQIGLQTLNPERTTPGSYFLYPPEPVTFINLLETHGEEKCDVKALIDESFKEKVSLWGSTFPTSEGDQMVSNLRLIWRKYLGAHPEEPLRGRKYVAIAFEYETEVPERILQIPNRFLKKLPTTLKELQKIFYEEQSTDNLKNNLAKILKIKTQSSLAIGFLKKRKTHSIPRQEGIGSHRFGPVTGPIAFEKFQVFYKNRQKEIIDSLLQHILQECERALEEKK